MRENDACAQLKTITLVSSPILYINVRDSELGTPTLMIGGAAYAVFVEGLGYLGALWIGTVLKCSEKDDTATDSGRKKGN